MPQRNKFFISYVFTIFSLLLFSANCAKADIIDIWHGWTNITPCSRVETNNDGVFGLPSITTRFADQELHGYVRLEVPTNSQQFIERTKQIATQCAIQGAAAAGATALITGGPGAWETFVSVFQGCMENTSVTDYLSINFDTEAICNW